MVTPDTTEGSWGATWLIVTGASRGLGAGICELFAPQMAPGSVVVGLARSKEGLDETARRVKEKNSQVQFIAITQDVSKCDVHSMEKILEDSLRLSNRKFARTILVHNAASLGKLDYLRTLDDLNYVKEYFNFNISTVLPLTTLFLRICRSLASNPRIQVINISSLAAVSPIKSWGLYCTAKAARDMLFKVLAAEEKNVDVLNYAPGPLDTEMQIEVRSCTSDPEIKSFMKGMADEGKLVKVEDTVKKLLGILQGGKYSSGDHVDYFDE
ncbi:UNVERIFIED_CONTAM: hypothetical protein GTU68_066225 [Idotea baltica]|nr:hypothetical protein [Idotea baltica]